MLDTIRVSTQIEIDYWEHLKGWTYNGKNMSKRKLVVLPNGATIFMEYYLLSRCLTLCFSASRIQHGTNAIAFDFEFNKVDDFKNTIEKSSTMNCISSCPVMTCCCADWTSIVTSPTKAKQRQKRLWHFSRKCFLLDTRNEKTIRRVLHPKTGSQVCGHTAKTSTLKRKRK